MIKQGGLFYTLNVKFNKPSFQNVVFKEFRAENLILIKRLLVYKANIRLKSVHR